MLLRRLLASLEIKWQDRNPILAEKAFVRALELLDLTISDPRWHGRRLERSFATLGLEVRNTGPGLQDLDRYFLAFAVAARR
jgi:hypothetical protein